MAFAAMIGPVISGIASLAGAAVSASAMQQEAQANRDIAAYNAQRDREKASLAQARGAQASRAKQREGDQAAALHRAVVAQGGASTTEATPLLIQQEFAKDTFHNSNVEIFNAATQEQDLRNKANITEFEGEVRAQAAEAKATASLISGFAGAAKGIAGAFG